MFHWISACDVILVAVFLALVVFTITARLRMRPK